MESMNDGTQVFGDYFHQTVHEGKLWEFYYETLSLPAGPTYFLLKTGAMPLHLVIRLEGTGRIKVDTLKSPTTSADGTPMVAGNYNAYRQVPLLATMFSGPTVSGEGTLKITKTLFGFAQGNSVLTSAFASGTERIWDPNAVYLLKITTVDTNPWFRMTIDCYEENI